MQNDKAKSDKFKKEGMNEEHARHTSNPQKQSVQTQKRKRSRWTRDDTELSILALPTTVWYALFCYLPMFGLVLAFKNYKISAGKSFSVQLVPQ